MTETLEKQLAGFLGLCARAGQLTLGQDACVSAIRAGSSALTLIDADASENTRKRIADSCASHGSPLYEAPAGMIAGAVGKSGRMTVVVKAGGMAQKLLSLLKDENPVQGAGAPENELR